MKQARRRPDEQQKPGPGAATIDSGEFRAVILAAGGLAVFLYFIKFILLPFVISGVIGYVATPLLDWLARRTRLPRLLFAAALFLVLFGLGALAAIYATEHAVAALRDVGTDLQTMIERFAAETLGNKTINVFGHAVNARVIAAFVVDSLAGWLSQSRGLFLVAGYSIAGIMGMFLTLVLLFYFLASGRRLAHAILWLAPPERRGLVERIFSKLHPLLLRYFAGVLAVVCYATIAAYIGLALILHIHDAALLAVMTGLLETIPVIGPIVAALIAGLVALQSATGITSIFAYAGYAIALRLSIDQLIGPLFLGEAAHMHPAIVIFCTLAGGIIYGIPGIILAIPVALAVKCTMAVLYGERL
jgi:predicted PurR-regulated permease PerM